MAWRVFNSLLVLRSQVDLLAPDRAKGADGTICDTSHPTTSDHCPHNVPGVGPEMVSALDLTHDPAGGFDSYAFAEVLRVHRDQRIKYVISDRRMFSSYATSSYPAWSWRPYGGTDPHTNHVHISVLDAPISDTSTPWNLEGFTVALSDLDVQRIWYTKNLPSAVPVMTPATALLDAFNDGNANRETLENSVLPRLAALEAKLDQILALLNQEGSGATFPPVSTFAATGTVNWTTTPTA